MLAKPYPPASGLPMLEGTIEKLPGRATPEYLADKRTEIRLLLKQTALNVLAIGRILLVEIRPFTHGRFEKWVETELGISVRLARHYMAAYKRFGDSPDDIQELAPTLIYLLASPSVSDEAVSKVLESGVTTPHEAQAILDQLDQANALDRAAQMAAQMIVQAAPGSVVMPADVKSTVQILTNMQLTGALDPGTGDMLPISEAVTAAITEETYERLKRQQTYIEQTRKQEAERQGGPSPSANGPSDSSRPKLTLYLDDSPEVLAERIVAGFKAHYPEDYLDRAADLLSRLGQVLRSTTPRLKPGA